LLRRAPEPWISDEPTLGVVVRQVLSRALRRPLLAVGLAAALTGLVVAYRLSKAPSYEATAYFRLVEGDVAGPGAATPRPPRLIREYVEAVALSRQKLLEIMGKYGLYRKIRARDVQLAIQSMREDIEVVVSRNYFIFARDSRDEPRSASISISYSFGSAEVARAVVHDLGQAVLDAQARQRSERLAADRQVTRAALEHANQEMKGLQAQLDLLWLDGANARGLELAENRAQIAAVQSRMKSTVARARTLGRRTSELELASAIEDSRLGIAFQLVDEELETIAPRLGRRQILKVVAAVFLSVLVVVLFVLGGWSQRIYVAQDLTGLGVPVLGTLVTFPGDDVGSYRARTGKRRRKTGTLEVRR
jgi:hypothetical protein